MLNRTQDLASQSLKFWDPFPWSGNIQGNVKVLNIPGSLVHICEQKGVHATLSYVPFAGLKFYVDQAGLENHRDLPAFAS